MNEFPSPAPAASRCTAPVCDSPSQRDAVLDAASNHMAAALGAVLEAARQTWAAAGLTASELDECAAAALLDNFTVPGAPLEGG